VNTNDGCITLGGVTFSQLQSQIRIRPGPAGAGLVSLFDPKYIASSGQCNTQYISLGTVAKMREGNKSF
jgi:hypothetical protein